MATIRRKWFTVAEDRFGHGLGIIGAWVFYIGRATTPKLRVLGFLKGLVWPAMLVYEVLKFFNEELPALQRPATKQPAPAQGPAQAQLSKPLVTPKARSARKPAGGAKSKTKKTARK